MLKICAFSLWLLYLIDVNINQHNLKGADDLLVTDLARLGFTYKMEELMLSIEKCACYCF